MPKMKTNKSCAKRFRKTKSGKFKHKQAFGAKSMTGKPASRRRRLRKPVMNSDADDRRIRTLLPYGA